MKLKNKTSLTTIILFSWLSINVSFSQVKQAMGELNSSTHVPVKQIKENGKAKIYYELKQYQYIPHTKIIDWKNSIRKIESQEPFKEKSIYLIENVKFEDGKKNGAFELSLCKLNVNQAMTGCYLTELVNVVKGQYVNNEYDGAISVYSFIDLKEKEGYLTLQYLNGKISDQILRYPYPITCTIGSKNFSITPQIVFKNGKVDEILSCETYPFYKKFNGSIIFNARYNGKPICFNQFSFLKTSDQQKNNFKSLIDLNVNTLTLEVFNSDLSGANEKIVGNYRLFKVNDNIFFDTSILISSYQYIDGKRNGKALIWDISKNGKSGDNPYIQLNYLDDLLNGVSQQYYPDGKLAISANFSKGYLVGETTTYYNMPNYKVFTVEPLVPRWVDNGGILMINQIGKWGDQDQEFIKSIKEKNGDISELNGHGLYSKTFFVLDSMQSNGVWYTGSIAFKEYTVFNSGKPMVTFTMNNEKKGQYSEIRYFDTNGKQVYSLRKAKEELLVKLDQLEKERIKKDNSIINCNWCKKSFRFGDRINLQECHCFDRTDSHSINLWVDLYSDKGLDFCSKDCRMKYEEECCRRNGYSFYKP